jgi:hypothetical protein
LRPAAARRRPPASQVWAPSDPSPRRQSESTTQVTERSAHTPAQRPFRFRGHRTPRFSVRADSGLAILWPQSLPRHPITPSLPPPAAIDRPLPPLDHRGAPRSGASTHAITANGWF